MESPSDGAGRHHPYTSPSEAPEESIQRAPVQHNGGSQRGPNPGGRRRRGRTLGGGLRLSAMPRLRTCARRTSTGLNKMPSGCTRRQKQRSIDGGGMFVKI